MYLWWSLGDADSEYECLSRFMCTWLSNIWTNAALLCVGIIVCLQIAAQYETCFRDVEIIHCGRSVKQ